MRVGADDAFKWLSPLGISVSLFLVIGVLWVLIGALTIPLHKRSGADIVFVSNGPDSSYFGGRPSELLSPDSPLAKLRSLLLIVIAGFLLLAGVTFVAIAWFGLRGGQAWTLYALAAAGGMAILVWTLALSAYVRAGVSLTLGDIPPFMWVPAVLIVPATVLGWLGLR